MKQQYLIFGVIAIVILISIIAFAKLKTSKKRHETGTNKPSKEIIPANTVTNDKLVIVEDVSENDIKKILQEFCNSYNKEMLQAIPRLTQVREKTFIVTFPYDINFEIYCYFINYVNYPIGFDRRFNATGWTTTKASDNWITEKTANKNVMVFVSDFDTEYDNVFLTTPDNIGYKLGFAMGEEKELLNKPEKNYVKQSINIGESEGKEYFDFK